MHSFEVYSNESACIKSGRLGLEQVISTYFVSVDNTSIIHTSVILQIKSWFTPKQTNIWYGMFRDTDWRNYEFIYYQYTLSLFVLVGFGYFELRTSCRLKVTLINVLKFLPNSTEISKWYILNTLCIPKVWYLPVLSICV